MPVTLPKKVLTFGYRWAPDRKARWEELAHSWKKDPGVFAREIVEEFLACFLTDEEIMRLGMVNHLGKRGAGWLEAARRKAEAASSTQSTSETRHGDSRKRRKRAS